MPASADSAATRRKLYSHEELLPLIRPGSVAIVGASATKAGFGTLALQRLTAAGFAGPLFAVHPRAEAGQSMHGVPTAGSLLDIEGGVDCVLVAVPAAAVEGVVRDAAESGSRSAIIFSAGFGETGADGLAAQRRILDLARAHDMRLGGPNTAGILNYRDGLPLTFVSDLAMELPVGTIGIVSQSGGLATHLGHVRHRGIGMSYTITTGNSVDVTALDYVRFLLDDDGTDVIALVLEGLDDPAGFAEIGARSVAAGKPIVLLKSGRTTAGSKAAVSHTGSLIGNHEVFLAAAAQAGIQVIDTTVELIETAAMYAKWARCPYHRGGVGVITTMGGAGVVAADAAADAGVDLPLPSPRTVQRVGQLVPAFATVANPIDTTASPPDPVLTEVITAVADDASYAAVVILAATMTGQSTSGRPGAIAEAGRRTATALAGVWVSNWADGPGTELLDRDPRIPLFRSSDRCMRAIARWTQWHERLLSGAAGTGNPDAQREFSEETREQFQDLVPAPGRDATRALDEAQSRKLLSAIGIGVPRGIVATSAAAAARAATAIGFPVAKVVSADVPHKADAGGVILSLQSQRQVADAYARIVDSVAAARPDAKIDGVLVAESLQTGLEFMCGLIRDPVFGPVVVCGAGGAAVEQIHDIAHVVAPITDATARRAVRRLAVYRRVHGRDAVRAGQLETGLAAVMGRLAALARAAPQIAEIDVNPIVLRSDGTVVALDGLVVLSARPE